jgi:hypothetical protein
MLLNGPRVAREVVFAEELEEDGGSLRARRVAGAVERRSVTDSAARQPTSVVSLQLFGRYQLQDGEVRR